MRSPRQAQPHGSSRNRSLVRRVVWRIARVMLLIWITWAAVLYFLQDRLLFPRHMARTTAQAGPDVEVWTIRTNNGETVEAWYLPPKGIQPPSDRSSASSPLAPAIIFCHGNAELIDNGLGQADMYRAMGYAVLLPEYRGYGSCGGRPSQRAITEDLVAFHDLLAARTDIDPDHIVYHGRSIGGGLACALAEKRAPAALILESTFTSVAAFAWGYGVPPFLCNNPLRSDRVLPTLKCPILLLHGENDTLVAPAHARRLASLSPHTTLRTAPGGHLDFPRDWGWYEAQIRSFLGAAH